MRRTPVLLLWAAALLLAALQIVRTPFTADLSAFLPAEPDARQRLLIDQLKVGLPSRMVMIGIEGGSAAQRAEASRALAQALRASGRFEQVQNGATDAWADIGQWLFARRYQLSPAVDAQHFGAAGLADAFADTLSLLGTPAGNLVKPLLERDPTGETQRIAETMIPSSAPRSVEGVWASRDGTRAVLLAVTRGVGADLDSQAATLELVRAAFAKAAPADARLTLQMSGTPVFSVDSRARIERDVHWLAAAATVLMCTLLWVAFASLPALAVAALPVASGVVVGIAAVGWVFGGVHGITLGFGATMIGEAVDYAIYYLIQARRAPDHADEPGWRRWLRQGWPTLRLGLLTSVCGFAVLMFSGFPGLRQLGVFSVAGLLAAAATTRWVLPVLMPDGARGMGLRRQLGRVAARALVWLPRTRGLWLVLAVAAAVLAWQRGHLWNADIAALSPVPRAALALDAQLRADITSHGDGGALVAVLGDDAETTLQRAELAGARLDALVERGAIGGYESAARLLPSQATQARRIAALPDAPTLQAAVQQATRGGPLAAARLAPFVAEVQQARQRRPDTLADAQAGPLAPLLSALLVPHSGGGYTALLPLQPPQRGEVPLAQVQAALQGVPGAQLLDIKAELDALYDRYLRQAQTQALLGALGVVVLMALTLRSPRRLLAVCWPLALAVLLTLGLQAAVGATLGILHLVGLLLVVAVGSNYALFFDLLRDAAVPDDDTLASLLLANVTMVLSFGLIGLSQIPALSAVGRVVAPGTFLALLLSAAFIGRRRAAI